MLLKSIFQLMSPAGERAKLTVLIFHRVLSECDPIFPDEMHAHRFNELCSWLASWFNVLPLDQAVTRMRVGSLPARAACITFDDGYADNYRVALPILQRHGLTATFFIATGFLNGGRMWNDSIVESVRRCEDSVLDLSCLGLGHHELKNTDARRATIDYLIDQVKYRTIDERVAITEQLAGLAEVNLPDDLMMTSNEVKIMHQEGMCIGAHTVSHPILAQLTDEQVRRQVQESKDFLENLLGERVGLFAYPNGKPGSDYTSSSVDVVRSLGFDAAVSTQWGTSGMGCDPFQIRRFTPWDRSRSRFGGRLLANLRIP